MDSEFIKIKSNLMSNGRYENPFGRSISVSEIFKYLKENHKYPVKPLTEQEKRDIHPVLKPDINLINSNYNHQTTIRSTWIGHSTCLVQLNGFNFLTDPMFSKRCSPSQLLPIGPLRYTDPACKISELPNIDFVVISHTHYDHLDYYSVCEIYKLFKSRFFVPKGMRQWFINAGIKDAQEMDWWEHVSFKEDLTIIYTPANHDSQRTIMDKNKSLWGSWIIKSKYQSIYFAGDTAYNDKPFKTIGHHYGPFNLSLIPIGAYDKIREVVRNSHIDPNEAVIIHKEIKSLKSFGIHHGTFILTNEPILEPPRLLAEEAQKHGLNKNEFFTSKIGETSIIITQDDNNNNNNNSNKINFNNNNI